MKEQLFRNLGRDDGTKINIVRIRAAATVKKKYYSNYRRHKWNQPGHSARHFKETSSAEKSDEAGNDEVRVWVATFLNIKQHTWFVVDSETSKGILHKPSIFVILEETNPVLKR